MPKLKLEDDPFIEDLENASEEQPVSSLIEMDDLVTILHRTVLAADDAGLRGQTREELEQVMDWAHEATAMYGALLGIYDGKIGAYVEEGELRFRRLSEESQRDCARRKISGDNQDS